MHRFLSILFLLLLLPIRSNTQSFYNFRDGFLDRKGEVESVLLTPEGQSPLTSTFDFKLFSTNNDSISGRLRIPNGMGPFPAALLCVGIETGREVIEMIEGQDSVFLMAVDYPFDEEWDFAGWSAFGTTFSLRSAGFRTVPLLLNCLDWLFEHNAVRKDDVSVVAVSFGAFMAVPAAVVEQRVKQLVVVQAGGDLPGILAHNSERWGVALPSWFSGWLGGAILAPFEPNKYIPHLSPRRLIMINGEGDSFFPRESAEALFDHALEPKEIIWHKSAHVAPGEKELIRELTNIVARKIYGGK